METAAGSRTDVRLPRAARVCRKCREPVTVQGGPQCGEAVHTATGEETGSGGHVAAPIDSDFVRPAVPRKASERS
jgi:hypothetical protein